jgi:uncharacterized membrane protein YkvA (DUF1232 family)
MAIKNKLIELNTNYLINGASKITDEDFRKVIDKSEEIKNKFNKKGPLGEFSEDINFLIYLVDDYWNKKYKRISWEEITTVVFTLLYVIKPIDFIPDLIPGIGLADDAGLVEVCLNLISNDLAAYKKWKKQNLKK